MSCIHLGGRGPGPIEKSARELSGKSGIAVLNTAGDAAKVRTELLSKLYHPAARVDNAASQYVLVSSPLRDLWTNITSCRKIAGWKLGALSDERMGLQFAV
jgi:hypothetical protein